MGRLRERLASRLADPRAWVVVAATVLGALVAFRSRGPMVDDVGILARYAERLADGHGWTYNDGDRTNGSSAPLYTMLLTLSHILGIDVLVAARAIGVGAGAACAGLVAHIGIRIEGVVAGVTGAALLLVWPFFQSQVTNGMESGLAVALGLAVVAALLADRDTAAGVLLGLALFNKLDAGLLAVAVAVAVVVVRGRPPWRIALLSAVLPGAWILGSWVYFGSPLPNSFTQKASGAVANPTRTYDPTWVIGQIAWHGYALLIPVAAAALALVPRLRRERAPAATATIVLVGWPLLHGLFFSLVDLGDTYHWYVVAMCPPICAAAGITIGHVVGTLGHRARAGLALAVAAVALVTAIALPVHRSPLRSALATARHGRIVSDYDGLEMARFAAGERLGQIAAPGDVVSTCFGWIAYHAPQTTIAESCPLNTREPVADPRWYVDITVGGHEPAPGPAGWVLAESFFSHVGDGARVDIYRNGPP